MESESMQQSYICCVSLDLRHWYAPMILHTEMVRHRHFTAQVGSKSVDGNIGNKHPRKFQIVRLQRVKTYLKQNKIQTKQDLPLDALKMETNQV